MTQLELQHIIYYLINEPMPAHEGALLFVEKFLSDLPSERQRQIREVLEEWVSARENFAVGSALSNSGEN